VHLIVRGDGSNQAGRAVDRRARKTGDGELRKEQRQNRALRNQAFAGLLEHLKIISAAGTRGQSNARFIDMLPVRAAIGLIRVNKSGIPP
jgi:hypothetical protein